MYDKPILIQAQNPDTEEWTDFCSAHATVNKASGGYNFNAGSDQFQISYNFDLRYQEMLTPIKFATQPFRIVFRGKTFKVVNYDDYMEQHKSIRLVGEYYE